jgi:HTH-type transcriptional regulator / antitoxin HigA
MGLDQSALEPMIGSKELVREVMAGKRQLTLEMIRRLHDELDISADVLIQPSTPDDATETSA